MFIKKECFLFIKKKRKKKEEEEEEERRGEEKKKRKMSLLVLVALLEYTSGSHIWRVGLGVYIRFCFLFHHYFLHYPGVLVTGISPLGTGVR